MDRYTLALLSLFVKAYHCDNSEEKIFDDYAAKLLLTAEECKQIPGYFLAGMSAGGREISGNSDEVLKTFINKYFSPFILTIAAFCEDNLERAAQGGVSQYLHIGGGYDTFFCRQTLWSANMEIFELEDHKLIYDKRKRISAAGLTVPDNVYFIGAEENLADSPRFLSSNLAFSNRKKTFVCIPYMTTAFSKNDFEKLIGNLEGYLAQGSYVLFDYPNELSPEGYSFDDIESTLIKYGLDTEEALTPMDITSRYFEKYNEKNTEEPIIAPQNMNYYIAIKQ